MRRLLTALVLVLALAGLAWQTLSIPPAPAPSTPQPPAQAPPEPRPHAPALPTRSTPWTGAPGRPEFLSFLDARTNTPEFLALAARGDLVFASTVNDILALRVGKSGQVEVLGPHGTMGRAFRLEVSGDYLAAADRSGLLRLYEVSDPVKPQLVWQVSDAQPTFGMAIQGKRLYRAVGTRGLVAHAFPPQDQVGSALDLGGSARDVVALQDGRVAVGLAEGSLRIVQEMREVGRVDLTGPVVRLAVEGDRVYAALGSRGLAEVDVSKPTTPRLVSHLPTRNAALDLAVRDGLVALAEWEEVTLARSRAGALEYVAARRLTGPREDRGRPSWHGLAMAVAFVGDQLLAAEWSSLFVMDPGADAGEQPPPPIEAAARGPAPAPDFQMALLGGGTTSRDAYRGRPLFLYFFSEG